MAEAKRFSEVLDRVNLVAINMPTHCPVCRTVLSIVDAFLVCPNSECPEKVKGTIRKFVTNLDIKNVGDETINSLVELGLVKTPADLYTITEAQFCRIPRKGKAHYEKMVAGLKARTKLPVERFFGALNIPDAGEGMFLNIVQAGFNTFDQIMSLTTDQALKANRIGEQAAHSIVSFLRDHRTEILRLKEYLQIESRAGKPLDGKSFIITGSCSRPKHEIYAEIEAAGGIVAKSVAKGLSYLITADPQSTSSKAQKARQLGVQMITEEQLKAMLQ